MNSLYIYIDLNGKVELVDGGSSINGSTLSSFYLLCPVLKNYYLLFTKFHTILASFSQCPHFTGGIKPSKLQRQKVVVRKQGLQVWAIFHV